MSAKSGTWRHRLGRSVQSLRRGTRAQVWWLVAAGIVMLTAVVLFAGYKSAPGAQGSGAQAGITSTASSSGPSATFSSSPQQSPTATNGPAQTSPAHSSVAQASSSQASVAQAPAAQTTQEQAVSAASTQSGQRLVIETANLDLTVSNLTKAGDQITQLTTQSGGFIETMQQSTQQQGQSLETLTIRVPESHFQSALGSVKSLGVVNNFSQTGQDVTSQNNDLQQQLAQLQSEAQAYTRLFNKASNMSDMLQIQQSLTQVNSQIASVNVQLHHLNRSVQLATLNITLHSSVIPIHQGSAPVWAPFIQSLHFMTRVGQGLFKVIAWVLPWAVLVGIVMAVVRVIRRRWHQAVSTRGATGGPDKNVIDSANTVESGNRGGAGDSDSGVSTGGPTGPTGPDKK